MNGTKDTLPRPLWVFGYASLLWNPGFSVAEEKHGVLQGLHRSFCMSSIHHRGSVEEPGLVLALDAQDGSSCEGVLLRVPDEGFDDVVAALRERELISSAYVEHLLPVKIADGSEIIALAYVIDPDHEQYVAHLTLEEQAQIIAHAIGGRGPNCEYLWNTVAKLHELNVADPELDWLADRVRTLKGETSRA